MRFLDTGEIGEYPPEVYIPLDRADRIYLLRQLLQACRTQNYRMLKENVASLDNELYLLFTFLDFCENLDSDMFYTKEETIQKLRDLIETA